MSDAEHSDIASMTSTTAALSETDVLSAFDEESWDASNSGTTSVLYQNVILAHTQVREFVVTTVTDVCHSLSCTAR